jgi:hypothetical protein
MLLFFLVYIYILIKKIEKNNEPENYLKPEILEKKQHFYDPFL